MNYLWAFLIGGVLCAVGQLLIDLTKLTPARILTGYVVAGVVLSAVGLYAPLAEFAGAGASVPLLGFGHLLAKGVRTAVEGRILRDFAPNATPAQRAQIRARVDAYEALARAENPDFNKLYEMDCRLHETWFAAMDKMYLWSTLQNAHADYSRFRMLDTMTTGGLDEVIADHRNLLNAIERCDLAAFEPLVERHLYGGIRRLGSKLTEEYADFFEPETVK